MSQTNDYQLKLMQWQSQLHQMKKAFIKFSCTKCATCFVHLQSPDYLLSVAQLKSELKDMFGIMSDFFAEWPVDCYCMQKLTVHFNDTFEMLKALFEKYPSAHDVFSLGEGEMETIKYFNIICKDAYKLNTIFIHVLNQCSEDHTFLRQYYYNPKHCQDCMC